MRPMLSYFGGKRTIADWIISNFPVDIHKLNYVEPCFGGGAIFFAKRPTRHEIISDLDDRLYNFYKVAQAEPVRLLKTLKRVICFEQEFQRATRVMKGVEEARDDLDRAVCVWIVISYGFTASVDCKTLRVGIDGGRPSMGASKRFLVRHHYPLLLDRIKNTTILNRPLMKMVDQFDRFNSFFYIDPPYPEVSQCYKHKFTPDDFKDLVERLKGLTGLFMLSFYRMDWMEFPSDWVLKSRRTTSTIGGHHAIAKSGCERTEWIAMNYSPQNDQLKFL